MSSTPEEKDAAKTSCVSSASGDNEEQYDEEGLIGIGSDLKNNSFDTTTTMSTSDREFAERSLPEDTFSFLIYCKVYSRSFVLGILVFLFQIGIYIILTANIVDPSTNESNPFGFPEDVSVPLRISEFLAILISIITQTDVRSAICLYRDGFDEAGLAQVFRGARFWKWSLSIGLRASEGLLGLIIAFLLIMKSPSVLELLLNFSAIEFVTMLDDTVFELVKEGFFGREMKKEAKRLIRKTYFVSRDCANSKSAFRVSILYFVVLFLSFFGSWATIASQQNRGFYFCDVISSQFSDEVLSIPSQGFYKRQEGTIGGRITYRHFDEGLLFAYCESEKRWTLSNVTDTDTNTTAWDPCKDWLAASSKSVGADSRTLLESASFPWLVKNQTAYRRVTAHLLECDGASDEGDTMINKLVKLPETSPSFPTIAPTSTPSSQSLASSTQPSLTRTLSTIAPIDVTSLHPSVASSNTPSPSMNPGVVTRKPSASVSPILDPTLFPTPAPNRVSRRPPSTKSKASKST